MCTSRVPNPGIGTGTQFWYRCIANKYMEQHMFVYTCTFIYTYTYTYTYTYPLISSAARSASAMTAMKPANLGHAEQTV